MLSKDEADELRVILEDLYGREIVANWNMNEGVLAVFKDMVERNKVCSVAMDYVPRPIPCGRPDLQVIRTQLEGSLQGLPSGMPGSPDSTGFCGVATKYTFCTKF